MNIEKLLIALAEAVLSTLDGNGRWAVYGTKWKPIDNPLRGLRVGDVVYAYYSGEETIEPATVIAVVDDVGYFLCEGEEPKLWPVRADSYSTTIKGLIELERETICDDIVYAERMQERVSKLKAMCEEYL